MPRSDCPCPDCRVLRERRERLRSPPTSERSSAPSSPVLMNRADVLSISDASLRSPRFYGRVYNVAVARNFAGHDAGRLCVTKWPRDGRHPAAAYYRHTVANAMLLAAVVNAFQRDVDTRGWRVFVNVPRVWKSGNGRNVLVDQYVHGWKTLVGGKGCRRDCGRAYMKVLEAICHYSYGRTQGRFMVTKLQGAVDMERKRVVIGDCRVSSVGRRGERGVDDGGPEQVRRFFKWHECSRICREFPKVKERRTFFTPVQSERERDSEESEESEEEEDGVWWR